MTPYFGMAIHQVVLDYSRESADYPDILIRDFPDSNRVVISQYCTLVTVREYG